jgi:hypothetical protein
MDDRTQQLIVECKRQEEVCLYTSTTIYEWLKELRFSRIVFVIAPIILGSVATWELIADQVGWKWLAGTSALLAGLIPALYKALDLDVSLTTLADKAHQFYILQDRFRQAAAVTSLGSSEGFKCEFADLMTRMDAARTSSFSPPERFVKRAQAKISKGHYDFRVDQLSPSRQSAAVVSSNLMQITTPKKSPNSL